MSIFGSWTSPKSPLNTSTSELRVSPRTRRAKKSKQIRNSDVEYAWWGNEYSKFSATFTTVSSHVVVQTSLGDGVPFYLRADEETKKIALVPDLVQATWWQKNDHDKYENAFCLLHHNDEQLIWKRVGSEYFELGADNDSFYYHSDGYLSVSTSSTVAAIGRYLATCEDHGEAILYFSTEVVKKDPCQRIVKFLSLDDTVSFFKNIAEDEKIELSSQPMVHLPRFFECLKENRVLKKLALVDCDLRDTGYHQLAKVVPKTCESIVLSGNHFPSFCSALALISMCLANEKLSIIFPSRKGSSKKAWDQYQIYNFLVSAGETKTPVHASHELDRIVRELCNSEDQVFSLLVEGATPVGKSSKTEQLRPTIEETLSVIFPLLHRFIELKKESAEGEEVEDDEDKGWLKGYHGQEIARNLMNKWRKLLVDGSVYAIEAGESDSVRSFVFFGPSGVGKTMLAELFAKSCNKGYLLYSCPSMNTETMLGARRGHVGYDDDPKLISTMLENKENGTVIVFDEFDKTNPEYVKPIMQQLVSMMDGLPFSDTKERTTTAAKCVFIFTTNWGEDAAEEERVSVVQKYFREAVGDGGGNAFVGRVTDWVAFEQHDEDEKLKLARKRLWERQKTAYNTRGQYLMWTKESVVAVSDGYGKLGLRRNAVLDDYHTKYFESLVEQDQKYKSFADVVLMVHKGGKGGDLLFSSSRSLTSRQRFNGSGSGCGFGMRKGKGEEKGRPKEIEKKKEKEKEKEKKKLMKGSQTQVQLQKEVKEEEIEKRILEKMKKEFNEELQIERSKRDEERKEIEKMKAELDAQMQGKREERIKREKREVEEHEARQKEREERKIKEEEVYTEKREERIKREKREVEEHEARQKEREERKIKEEARQKEREERKIKEEEVYTEKREERIKREKREVEEYEARQKEREERKIKEEARQKEREERKIKEEEAYTEKREERIKREKREIEEYEARQKEREERKIREEEAYAQKREKEQKKKDKELKKEHTKERAKEFAMNASLILSVAAVITLLVKVTVLPLISAGGLFCVVVLVLTAAVIAYLYSQSSDSLHAKAALFIVIIWISGGAVVGGMFLFGAVGKKKGIIYVSLWSAICVMVLLLLARAVWHRRKESKRKQDEEECGDDSDVYQKDECTPLLKGLK